MKKKILSIMIVSAMLLSSAAAMAEETTANNTAADTTASEQVNETAQAPFARNDNLNVVSVEDGKIETTAEDGSTIYINTAKAVIYKIDGTELSVDDIKAADSITVFTRATEPTLAIYPPEYTPAVIIVNDEDYAGSVAVSNFTKNEEGPGYINAEKDLIVNMPEDYDGAEGDMIVFYTIATMSIPPQTTPDKLVLLEEPVVESSYDDVSDDVWYAESVAEVTSRGLFNGISDTEFAPEGDMTRAMFVTVLGRLDGVAVKDACVTGFEDTPGDQYYSSYVAWANMNNIVNGYDDGTFRPDQVVTREEAMQIILNYCEYKGIGPEGEWAVLVDYADADQIADYAMDAAMWNVIHGYLLEDENGNINPDETADRAEIAYAMDVLAGQLGK